MACGQGQVAPGPPMASDQVPRTQVRQHPSVHADRHGLPSLQVENLGRSSVLGPHELEPILVL